MCKFAALPSVRRLQGADIEWALEDQEELWPRRATGGFSGADEVHFEGRYVYSPELRQFLGGLDLKSLSFITTPVYIDHEHDEDAERRLNLREFTTLKYAALTCVFFVEFEGKQRPPDMLDGIRPYATDREARNVSRLVDVLPASLETLHLFGTGIPPRTEEYREDDEEEEILYVGSPLEDMFMGLSRLKQDRLPKLRCIILEGQVIKYQVEQKDE
ncbi:MAG: hypothetical protein Q9210_005708 [Variospora velana]